MSNSIWHKPSETTDVDNNLIIHDWTDRTYELGYFDDNEMIFRNLRNDDTYSEESMMCWCDINDLIAQADKVERLEKENEAMREEFEVWHGNHKCVLEDKERLQKVVFFLSGHLRDVLQLDEYGHIKLDEITKQQIKTAISDPVGIIMQLEQESNN